jgi:hypothetical protein
MFLRAANGLFALMYLFSAAVQYNDPDPLRWMAMYLAGAATCVAWELRKMPRVVPIAVGLVAFAWSAWTLANVHLTAPVGEALSDWHMHAGGSEELREGLGLAIVVAWMAVLAVKPQRAQRS